MLSHSFIKKNSTVPIFSIYFQKKKNPPQKKSFFCREIHLLSSGRSLELEVILFKMERTIAFTARSYLSTKKNNNG